MEVNLKHVFNDIGEDTWVKGKIRKFDHDKHNNVRRSGQVQVRFVYALFNHKYHVRWYHLDNEKEVRSSAKQKVHIATIIETDESMGEQQNVVKKFPQVPALGKTPATINLMREEEEEDETLERQKNMLSHYSECVLQKIEVKRRNDLDSDARQCLRGMSFCEGTNYSKEILNIVFKKRYNLPNKRIRARISFDDFDIHHPKKM